MQDKNRNESIELEENFNFKETKIFGLYDPEDFFSELLLLVLFKFDVLFSILALSTFQISTGCSSAETTNPKNKVSMIEKFFYLTILKFSLGIIFVFLFRVQENLFY